MTGPPVAGEPERIVIIHDELDIPGLYCSIGYFHAQRSPSAAHRTDSPPSSGPAFRCLINPGRRPIELAGEVPAGATPSNYRCRMK